MISSMQSKYYKLVNGSLKIGTNAPNWMNQIECFLSLPQLPYSEPPLIEYELLEVEYNQFDDILPLPEQCQSLFNSTMKLNKDIPFRFFAQKEQEWTDYWGYARTNIDYGTGKAKIIIAKNSEIHTYYSLVLLVYNAINSLFFQLGFVPVHSSGAVVNGKGILLTGNSGRGKSTSAMALLQAGYPLLSDEKVLLHRKGNNYHGFSISPVVKLRKSAQHLFFPNMDNNLSFFSDEEESAFRLDEIPGGTFVSESRIHFLLTIEQSGKPESIITQVHPTLVISELFPVTLGPTDRYRIEQKFEFLMDFLSETPCYKLMFGTSMDHFVSCIEDLTS